MLKREIQRRIIYFSHDLIADWARYRTLLSHEKDLAVSCENRSINPHWHIAIRLYGLFLLEQDGSGKKWQDTINICPKLENAFLESLVFASNSQNLINNIWSFLIANNGKLLRAFLKRFQYIASVPNSQFMEIAVQTKIGLEEAQTWERIPLGIYWLGILNALVEHIDDLSKLAHLETAALTRSWLRYTPANYPGRQAAATLAVAIAQQVIHTKTYYCRKEDDAQLPFSALLEAYPDKPDEVRELLLTAAARKIPTEKDGDAFEYYKLPGTITHINSIFICKLIEQEPWPDGPLYHVNNTFRKTCIKTDALQAIMLNAPDLAKKLILALLIEKRPPLEDPMQFSHAVPSQKRVGLEDDHDFYPRFYIRGPFLRFLRINPQVALETIIRLVDFATERWLEYNYQENTDGIGMSLPLAHQSKFFICDKKIYHWYHGYADSSIVTSALMAIEKWLYECIDRKDPINHWVELILETGHSAAFIGMLSEVGKYTTDLFTNLLKPLLLIPDTYYFDSLYANESKLGTPPSFREGEWFFNLAREWDTMKHRQYSLVNIAVFFFHNHKEMYDSILAACRKWQEIPQGNNTGLSNYKNTLIAIFDKQNWKDAELEDGTKGIAFKRPDFLEPSHDEKIQNEKSILLMTIPFECRRLLTGEKILVPEEIPAFLERSKSLIDFNVDDTEISSLAPTANIIMGTIAVLFLLHRDWLKDNPDEEKWAIEILDHILENPPPSTEFDFPSSIGTESWEHFACDIAPVLWAENPTDQKSRIRIAKLVFAKHYNAVDILLFRAFERRKIIGDAFGELVNLMLAWAAIRHETYDKKHTGTEKNIAAKMDKALNRFIAGKYSATIPHWGYRSIKNGRLWSAYNSHASYHGDNNIHRISLLNKLDLQKIKTMCKNVIRWVNKASKQYFMNQPSDSNTKSPVSNTYLYRHKNREVNLLSYLPHLDLQQIQSAFNSVFLLEQASSDLERQQFLTFWDEALFVSLEGIHFFNERKIEFNSELIEAGIPNDYDNWVLKRLVVIISQMHPDENPERYWKPILSRGVNAEHWVDYFLSYWFMDAKKTMDKKAFIREWRKMLEFCLSLKSWSPDNQLFNFKISSLRLKLIGISDTAISFWDNNDVSIIEDLSTYIINIASSVLNSSRDTIRLLWWLNEPSAKGIRRAMLKSIAETALKTSEYWWQEDDMAKLMAQYLGLLWQEHGQSIVQHPDENKNFQELVARTASTQEPLAIDLQMRMFSHK